jgi:hypothetical protein
MASLTSESFCTVREFPASLDDQHLLPTAKIGTQREYKNKSGRRRPAKRPSTRMRFSSVLALGCVSRHLRTVINDTHAPRGLCASERTGGYVRAADLGEWSRIFLCQRAPQSPLSLAFLLDATLCINTAPLKLNIFWLIALGSARRIRPNGKSSG